MRALVFAVASIVLSACFVSRSGYHAGELRAATALGCLDVAIARVRHVAGFDGVVLEWRIGNACDHSVRIDLAGARVIAIGAAFARTPLVAVDRYHDLAPGWLDAGETAYVRVAYAAQTPSPDDSTIEIELDRFAETSHRHTTIRLVAAADAVEPALRKPDPPPSLVPERSW